MGDDRTTSEGRWDVSLYESKHSFVWEFAAELLDLLSPRPGERILDLGCGTGHLTGKIAGMGAAVVGVDSEPAMIEQARRNYPGTRFELGDARKLGFERSFDAVFSNAALHWIPEAEEVVARVWRALKPDGRFVAEFGGKGNIRSIVAALRKALGEVGATAKRDLQPWYFPSASEYTALLEQQGFSVTYARLFSRPTPLEGGDEGMHHWMDMFPTPFLAGLSMKDRGQVIRKVEERLRPRLYRDGRWVADYRRLRVVAVKEAAQT